MIKKIKYKYNNLQMEIKNKIWIKKKFNKKI